jgi:hypothetical protein
MSELLTSESYYSLLNLNQSLKCQATIDDYNGDAGEIARNVRKAWYMPAGPVKT